MLQGIKPSAAALSVDAALTDLCRCACQRALRRTSQKPRTLRLAQLPARAPPPALLASTRSSQCMSACPCADRLRPSCCLHEMIPSRLCLEFVAARMAAAPLWARLTLLAQDLLLSQRRRHRARNRATKAGDGHLPLLISHLPLPLLLLAHLFCKGLTSLFSPCCLGSLTLSCAPRSQRRHHPRALARLPLAFACRSDFSFSASSCCCEPLFRW